MKKQSQKMRKEKDSFGFISVPQSAYYGAHTARSIQNFQISGKALSEELLTSIILIKESCARANHELGFLSLAKKNAICIAGKKIRARQVQPFIELFPVDIFQAGSGTSTNMNVNEVLGNVATKLLPPSRSGKKERVHPNDEVNKGQSTNNVFPSAIRLTLLRLLPSFLEQLDLLTKSFAKKEKEFQSILKSGRTHLQDAVPLTLGQEFGAYKQTLLKHKKRIQLQSTFLQELGVGGNAVGTGLNTSPEFRKTIIKHLSKETGLPLKVAQDGIEATQFLSDQASAMEQLKIFALDLNKIANDLRLLSSGPKTGLGEIVLPPVEPGSSIMPGKINPSICEATNMVCYQVLGNAATVCACATAGNLDLNTHMPVLGNSCIESLELLTNTCRMFREKCVSGITANKEQCEWYVSHSMALATALNPLLGYDKVSELVKESLKTNTPVKELLIKKKLFSRAEVDKILDPKKLTKPNLAKKVKK